MTTRTYSDWFEVEHNGEDVEVLVSFTVTPYVAATYWQPAEGGEVELLSAETINKVDILDRLSGLAQQEIIDEIAMNRERYDDSPDPDDERDRRIDARLTGDDQ